MELEQLRIFCAVAACRSFTRAAKELFVSHSTTSRAVTALERELGVPLLTRDRHTVALTGAGASDRGGGAFARRGRPRGRRARSGGAVGNGGKMNWSDCTNFFVNFLHFSEKPS